MDSQRSQLRPIKDSNDTQITPKNRSNLKWSKMRTKKDPNEAQIASKIGSEYDSKEGFSIICGIPKWIIKEVRSETHEKLK